MSSLDLHSLKLRNFRCFEALDIEFHPKLTVLVASNGAGKTSILDAISVAFGTYLGAFDEAVGPGLIGSDIRLFRPRETSTNEMEYAQDGVQIEVNGFIPGATVTGTNDGRAYTTWSRGLSSPTKAKTTVRDARELTDYGKRMQAAVRTPGAQEVLPLLAYYGTGRLWQQKKQTEGKKPEGEKISRTSRTVGYTDCLDPASKYKAFFAWFRYWNLNAKVNQVKALEAGRPLETSEMDLYIQSVTSAVNACLAPSGWGDISYSFSQEALVAQHPDFGELQAEWLSDGIRNMIGMVADIAYRATKLNPHLGADASKRTPGIVLIDEVDMHLHPEWQQVVLKGLADAFPEVQFVVTTHSPQVLSSVKSESVRMLGRSEVQQPALEIKGTESSVALNQVLSVNPVPPVEEAAWQTDYIAKIENGTHEDADGLALRAKLLATYGKDHPVIQDADRLIRFQAFKLRQQAASRD